MPDISKIILPEVNTTYDILSKQTRGIVRATKEATSTATNFVLTASGITELYDGLLIMFRNDATASASGVVINLNELGGKQVWGSDQNARVSSSLKANSEYLIYYDSTNDRFVKYEGTYTANSNTIGEYAGSCVASGVGMPRYALIMQTSNTGNTVTWEGVVTTSGTGTSKAKNTNGFILGSPVLYQSAGTYASGETAGQSAVWQTGYNVDTRYSCNVSSSWSVAGRPFFLKGTINANDGKFYLADTTWWSDAYPTTNDGYYYIYVGQMSDKYRLSLYAVHPIFYFDTALRTLLVGNVANAQTVNGHTVNADVPSGAVFTDEKVTQTFSGSDDAFPVLFSSTTTSNTTAGVLKSYNLTFNPVEKELALQQRISDDSTSFRVTDNTGNDVIRVEAGSNVIDATGSLRVDGDIDTTMLYAGDVDVSGSLFADTLNGVTIGNSPEFTDTQSDWSASSGKAQILNKPTLGTASAKDVPASGNASTTQVVMGNDTRLTDARTPSSHTHGNIQNGGTISSTAVTPASTDYLLISDTSNSGKIERGIAIGTNTTKYLRNDGTWEVPSGGSVGQIYYCETDSTSTTTAFVVNATGVTALTDGLILCIKNTISASASGCTINVNNLGAKSIWLSEANSACTTQWKANTTYLFVFDYTNDRWVMQTGRDTDTIGNDIVARYSRLQTSGNGVKQYSVFALLPNGMVSSFTTTNGTGTKTFDTTNYFDIRNVFAYTGSSNKASGEWLGASAWKLQGYDVDMRYSFNGVTTKASTSSLATDGMVYLVFDPSAESGGCYKLKSPYYTQTPTSTGCIYVLLGVMRDTYRLDLWCYNPAFTYDGTKLVPFANSTLSGLVDTSITNPSAGDIITYDGFDWYNTNTIALKDSNGHTSVLLDGNTGTITSENTPSTGGFTVNDVVIGGFTTGSGNYFKFSLPFANTATSASITSIDQTSAGTKVMLPNTVLQTNFIDLANSIVSSVTKDWITFEFKLNSTQSANTPGTIVLTSLTFELF